MAQKSTIVPIAEDAKATAIDIERAIKEAGIDGIVVEINMKHKYNEYVVKVNRKGLFPRDDEWD